MWLTRADFVPFSVSISVFSPFLISGAKSFHPLFMDSPSILHLTYHRHPTKRRYFSPPRVLLHIQRQLESNPPPPFSMFYPPAATRFIANSLALMSPHYVQPVGGSGVGGRGRRGGRSLLSSSGMGGRGTLPPSTAKKSATSQRPLPSTAKSAKRPKTTTAPTRMSPRLHPDMAQKQLPAPRTLLSAIQESASPSSPPFSPDLLEETQANTVVPETQLDGAMPPLRSVATSSNYEASQMTTASGLEEEDDQQPFSGSPGGFSSPQGSANDEEEEDIGEEEEQDMAQAQLEDINPFDDILVESAVTFEFPERLAYFLGGNTINNRNRQSVENCLIAEAGRIITEENRTATKTELKSMIVDAYRRVLESLDEGLFSSETLRKQMAIRLFNGRKGEFGARKMWELWEDLKSKMKKVFASLPTNYHTMKSGEQLYQVYSRVVRDQFIVDYVRVIHSPVSNCVHSLTPLNYVLYRKTIVRGNLMRK
jgi:hypothetical protein